MDMVLAFMGTCVFLLAIMAYVIVRIENKQDKERQSSSGKSSGEGSGK